jgi:hypothetical protein
MGNGVREGARSVDRRSGPHGGSGAAMGRGRRAVGPQEPRSVTPGRAGRRLQGTTGRAVGLASMSSRCALRRSAILPWSRLRARCRKDRCRGRRGAGSAAGRDSIGSQPDRDIGRAGRAWKPRLVLRIPLALRTLQTMWALRTCRELSRLEVARHQRAVLHLAGTRPGEGNTYAHQTDVMPA